LRVDIARLPEEPREHTCEVRNVLPGAAADLKHKAAGGKRPCEHLEYRTLVALGGAGKAAAVTDVLADLPTHRGLPADASSLPSSPRARGYPSAIPVCPESS